MHAKKSFELTLGLIKPELACNVRHVQYIQAQILRNKFYILKCREVYWTRQIAAKFYAQHSQQFFFKRLVDYMSSGPIIAMVLGKRNAILDWRKLAGPTKVYTTRFTAPHTFRGKFGLTDTRNTVHGSDSTQSVADEIHQIFPDFDIEFWIHRQLYHHNEFKLINGYGMHSFDDAWEASNVLLQTTPDEAKHSVADRVRRELGLQDTWRQFYQSKVPVRTEWFVDYARLKPHLATYLRGATSLLDVGCGTSTLGPSVAGDFPHVRVHCLDTSVHCLRTLSALDDDDGGGCRYIVADASRNLPFASDSVDVVVDKGTSDAVARQPDGEARVAAMFGEAVRVLRPGGRLLHVTSECPDVHLDLLRSFRLPVRVSCVQLEGDTLDQLTTFLYSLTKDAES